MAKDPESFDELIDALADGTAVDWKNVERAGRIGKRELAAARAIERLRDSSDRLAASAAFDPMETDLARGFERLEELGHGAFGRVWRARDRVLGREVALKVLQPHQSLTSEQRARFVREARVLAACEHENIVRVHSIEEREGRLELCLELLDGVNLEKLVRDGGVRSAEEAASVGADLCRALATLHSRGLVHRDVKPANVMRAQGGRIVLLDFGLAHAADPAQRRGMTTGGTPLFMAPELLGGAVEFDGRVDLFSLGVTLYWLVTATKPYEAGSREELFEKMEREPPVPLVDRRPDLPPEFVAIVERAMARDPAQRFASAGEMDSALRAFLSKRKRAGLWKALGAVVGAAVLVVAAIVGWRLRPIRAELTFGVRKEVQGSSDAEILPLAAGAILSAGEPLGARLTLNHDAYVYAFNADQVGQSFAIFPLEYSTLKNPLPAGTSLLPGHDVHGEPILWGTDGKGIEDTFIFFIAREPNPDLQTLWEQFPKAETWDVSVGGGSVRGAGVTSRPTTASSSASDRQRIDDLRRYAAERASSAGVIVRSFAYKSGSE